VLSDTDKQVLRDRLKAIAQTLPGFRPRAGQRVMIAAIARTLTATPRKAEAGAVPLPLPSDGSNLILVNGGTGIGKSLGYVLPAFAAAQDKGLKLVIASSTVALQEQLFERDLPAFFHAWGVAPKFELAKGRTRYVCPYRLQEAVAAQQQVDLFAGDVAHACRHDDAAAGATLDAMQAHVADGRWNGDRDAWATPLDDRLWQAVTTDRHGCLGRRCPHAGGCPQLEARRRIREADVVVANHDLVLADLANAAKLLGPARVAIYVFDEAHHLPEKAVSAFAQRHALGASRRALARLAKLAASVVAVVPPADRACVERLREEALALERDLGEVHAYFAALASLVPTDAVPRPSLAFPESGFPQALTARAQAINRTSGTLREALGAVLDALVRERGADRTRQPRVDRLTAELGIHAGQIEAIGKTWALLVCAPKPDAPPIAKWVEAIGAKRGMAGASVDFQLNASPVVAGAYLRALLWREVAGAVMTSATLTSLGTFDDFVRRAGLRGFPALSCVDLPSPFDYRSQAALEIVPLAASPKDAVAHTAEIQSYIAAYIGADIDEGTLVLFTSRSQMEAVAQGLPTALRARVLMQGEAPKSQLVRRHCARIDRGEPATLFGLDSFAEGVDLPGRYCTHVVIVRLPFAVPDTPVHSALSTWIARRGGNPFVALSVPDTARKLEQRAGRLIRTETDRGRITVLDTRLWTTSYGQQILRGLPPFRLIAMGREVVLQDGGAPRADAASGRRRP
jgi:ATP-dependent DNA helicase DinG